MPNDTQFLKPDVFTIEDDKRGIIRNIEPIEEIAAAAQLCEGRVV